MSDQRDVKAMRSTKAVRSKATHPDSTEATAAAPMGRRERGKADKMSRIKIAARELFLSRGYEATTTQAIAKEAGIGVGTLFSYAKTKEDLLVTVFIDDLIEAANAARMRSRKRLSTDDKLFTLYEGLLKYHFENIELSSHLLREMTFVRDKQRAIEVGRLMSILFGASLSVFLDAQADGRLSEEIEADRLCRNCFSIYRYLLQESLRESMPFKAAAEELRARLALQLRPLQLPPRKAP